MGNPVKFVQLASSGNSLANSLRLSGYPESIARNPRRFWDKKSFMGTLESYFTQHPDEMYDFAGAIRDGLDAVKSSSYPDYAKRLFFVCLAYKCKGRL